MSENTPEDYLSDFRKVIENDEARLRDDSGLLNKATGLRPYWRADQFPSGTFSGYLVLREEETIGYIRMLGPRPLEYETRRYNN